MESKNRLLISVAVILLIVGAIFTSFGRSLFSLDTPSVDLPTPDSSSGSLSSPDPTPQSGVHQLVEVTPQTVQHVIASLSRPVSYSRELTVEYLWGTGSSNTTVQFWTDNGWSHTRQIQPSGLIRHDLVGEGTWYYWYEGYQQYEKAPANERSSDLSQHIPTYETVLQLEQDTIAEAGYELRSNIPCVYVVTNHPDLNLQARYWISADSGLLISAEQEQDGQLVYRMTAYSSVLAPCPSTAAFRLPDGTQLHSVA